MSWPASELVHSEEAPSSAKYGFQTIGKLEEGLTWRDVARCS